MKKEETPFNPLIIPDLVLPATTPSPTNGAPRRARKPTGTARTRRALDPQRSVLRLAARVRRKARISWQRIKGGLHAHLAHLDPVLLKQMLIACGIAAATAVTAVALCKMIPVGLALLAVLGLGLLLRFWQELRRILCLP